MSSVNYMNIVRCTWNMPEEKPRTGCPPLMARDPFFLARQMVAVCHSPVPGTIHTTLATSLGDPWHFGADPHLWLMDPDPTSFFNDFKEVKKKFNFFLITYAQYIIFSLKNLIFCWSFVLRFYLSSIISVRSRHLWEKGRIRIRIRTSD